MLYTNGINDLIREMIDPLYVASGFGVGLLVGMTVLNGAKPTWGKHVDPLAAMFDLVEGDATARPIAVLAGWLVVSAIAGIAVTRRREIS